MIIRYLYIFAFASLLLSSCNRHPKVETTPWGTVVGEDSAYAEGFSLADIQTNGELIVLTLSGPDTYYEYHGRGMGLHFLLAERFAQKIGVLLRMEVCKDTAEMVRRLNAGEGDVMACMMRKGTGGTVCAGVRDSSGTKGWAVSARNKDLASALDSWFRLSMVSEVSREERFALSGKGVRRKVYSPMLNRKGGVISRYDNLFRQYAPLARWDWRLIAAQCYQESTFDPQARSWAGACGLMQIMPSTADMIGLAHEDIHDPEKNVEAACRYIGQLSRKFADVHGREERTKFVLASYNGGFYHIRDAMALAEKNGKDKYVWNDVKEFVQALQQPRYYNDPIVKNGYMRGTETVGYVEKIMTRYADYRKVAHGESAFSTFGQGSLSPRRSSKANRYQVN